MSVATIVTIKLNGLVLNGETFSKLDNCFAAEELWPHNTIKVYPPLPADWETSGYNFNENIKTKFDLKERETALLQGDSIFLKYMTKDQRSAIIDVKIDYSPLLLCTQIKLDATTEPRTEYFKKQIKCAQALYNVSLCLHKTFGAIDTSAIVDAWLDYSDPWFHFSETEWKTADFVLTRDTGED